MKGKKSPQGVCMEDRLLTICGQYNASNKKVPVLTLKGTWFDEAGFKIGD